VPNSGRKCPTVLVHTPIHAEEALQSHMHTCANQHRTHCEAVPCLLPCSTAAPSANDAQACTQLPHMQPHPLLAAGCTPVLLSPAQRMRLDLPPR
jgi:hypothetical protein